MIDNRHKKDACPEPKVFKGACKTCGEEGHPASKCEVKVCYNCKEKGHATGECTKNRVFDSTDVPEMPAEEAWANLQKSDEAGELDDIREVSYPLQDLIEESNRFHLGC